MQKVINVISLLSGVVSLSIVGVGGYLYLNSDTLIEEARERVAEEVTTAVMEAVPGIVGGLMPEVPKMPKTTGGAIPSDGVGFPGGGGTLPF